MNLNNILPMLLALGGSGALLYSLKSVPTFIFRKIKQRLIYSVTVYQYEDLFNVLEKWLSTHHSNRYRDVEAKIETVDVPQNEKENISESIISSSSVTRRVIKRYLTYHQEVTGYFIKFKNKRIFVDKSKEKMDKAGTGLKEAYLKRYTLSGLGAKDTINSLLDEATEAFYSASPKNAVPTSYNSSYGEWYVAKEIRVKPFEKVILKDKQFILKDISDWADSEKWYADRGIPYRRGYCFYGPPGTGKTTLALALASEMGKSVYCLNLNCLSDDSKLNSLFANIPGNALLLIEDIDRVFSGRNNVKQDAKISFSGLLNCLDGAMAKHGLVTMITTNYIDKLDPALLRPGRMDVKIKVDKPDAEAISEFLTMFYEVPMSVIGEFQLSMTQVQEICMRNKTNPEKAKHTIYSKQHENGHVHKAEV